MSTRRGSRIGRVVWVCVLAALIVFGVGPAPDLIEGLAPGSSEPGLAASLISLAFMVLVPVAVLALAILASYVVRVDLLPSLGAVFRERLAKRWPERADATRRLSLWVLPIVLLVLVLVVAAGVVLWVQLTLDATATATAGGESPLAGSLRGLALAVLAWGAMLFAVISVFTLLGAALRGGKENRRESRHRRGKYTSKERAQLELQRASHERLTAALRFRDELLNKRVPKGIDVWDFRASPDEVFFQDAPATYARYYGRDVSYTTTSGFFFGNPAFVAAGLAINAIGNASARSSAEREAAEQWREWQTARVLISNQRLVCFAGGRWLSFWYSGVVASYPSLRERSLVLQFGDAEPLMLVGDHVPVAIMMATYSMHGERGLAGHPDLIAAASALAAAEPTPPPRA